MGEPDLVATMNHRVCVIGSQLVSGSQPLDVAHESIAAKYPDNQDVVTVVKSWHEKSYKSVDSSSGTLLWRGVSSAKSADFLFELGLTKRFLMDITTRVLLGSYVNWTR